MLAFSSILSCLSFLSLRRLLTGFKTQFAAFERNDNDHLRPMPGLGSVFLHSRALGFGRRKAGRLMSLAAIFRESIGTKWSFKLFQSCICHLQQAIYLDM